MPRKRRYVPPFSSWFFDPFEEPNTTNMNEACGFKISNVCNLKPCYLCNQLLANAKENDNGNRSDSETSNSNQVFQRRYCGVVHDAHNSERISEVVLRMVHAAPGGKGRMLALPEKPE